MILFVVSPSLNILKDNSQPVTASLPKMVHTGQF